MPDKVVVHAFNNFIRVKRWDGRDCIVSTSFMLVVDNGIVIDGLTVWLFVYDHFV